MLKYAKEIVLLLSMTGAIFLGKINPEKYSETTKLVLVSTISGYFGMSIPNASSDSKKQNETE